MTFWTLPSSDFHILQLFAPKRVFVVAPGHYVFSYSAIFGQFWRIFGGSHWMTGEKSGRASQWLKDESIERAVSKVSTDAICDERNSSAHLCIKINAKGLMDLLSVSLYIHKHTRMSATRLSLCCYSRDPLWLLLLWLGIMKPAGTNMLVNYDVTDN